MQPYMFSKQDEEREKKWKEYLAIYNQYVDFYHNELLKKRHLLKCKRLFKEKIFRKRGGKEI